MLTGTSVTPRAQIYMRKYVNNLKSKYITIPPLSCLKIDVYLYLPCLNSGARGLWGPVLLVARTKVTPLCCKTGSLPGGQRVAVEAATPREDGKPAAQSSRYRPLRSVTLGSPYPTTPDPSVTEHSNRHHSQSPKRARDAARRREAGSTELAMPPTALSNTGVPLPYHTGPQCY